jgi:hypothetical protein
MELQKVEPSQTIPEFCESERISIGLYYKLKRRGLGPREMKLGKSVRITPSARGDWHRRMEVTSKAEGE